MDWGDGGHITKRSDLEIGSLENKTRGGLSGKNGTLRGGVAALKKHEVATLR
jgi:hypothetical protein